jgi:hypothetical protein
MSDQWQFYPCQLGEHQAFITFDSGIAETIDESAPAHLLKIRIPFQHATEEGLPGDDELEPLSEFEDALAEWLEHQNCAYLGRITVDGHRHFYIATDVAEEAAWEELLGSLENPHGYELAFAIEENGSRTGYWEEIYPTPDDWRVISDLQVIEALEQHGDNCETVRQIDHWAYFLTQDAADQFAKWAREQGYEVASVGLAEKDEEAEADEELDPRIQVRFSHQGPVTLADISGHTIALGHQAEEIGGEYDGWETPICKDAE